MPSIALWQKVTATIFGTISGTGSLTFAGPERLTLAADNTFTGDTRISSGTLAIGNVSALQNSTLDMNASDSGAITFNTSAVLGGLEGSRNLDNGGQDLAIGSSDQSTTYSGVLSGTAVVNGDVLVNGVHAPGNSLGGSLLDSNDLSLDAGTRGYFSLALIGQDVVLQYTAVAVPEPSTTAIALAGLAYGGYTMWRRRKRS